MSARAGSARGARTARSYLPPVTIAILLFDVEPRAARHAELTRRRVERGAVLAFLARRRLRRAPLEARVEGRHLIRAGRAR